ncbi:hypothetical protein MAR_003380 [Mya arenaria]|uniref:Uncharacterized protein n=1 Tax=Mya arenaria TaxID=6604 RepID=A0ABY7G5U1_MYAAR|nr:hypothetical protein MAR_003380 [Mya arenaria]
MTPRYKNCGLTNLENGERGNAIRESNEEAIQTDEKRKKLSDKKLENQLEIEIGIQEIAKSIITIISVPLKTIASFAE